MNLEVGKILGNFMGEFVEYDPKNSSVFRKLFMRVRVKIDARHPLKRGKKIGRANRIVSLVIGSCRLFL